MANSELPHIGKYELEAKIAQGGMAEIFLARQPGIGGFSRRVVLKCILPLLADEPRFVQMFLEEARLASQIHHPNVVQIFDVGEEDEHYFIAMEYINGLPVGSMMTLTSGDQRALPPEVACEIIIQACAGLHAAHQLRDEEGNPLGLVHRDVSPQNLMVSLDGVVKLVDFGIAKAQDSSVTTRTGNIKGKYAYMSPEQVRGHPLDRRSDIFSLGTLLYEMLTGERLFHRNAELAILVAIIEDPFPSAHETNSELPRELSDLILHALERDKDKRFATAAEMGAALREVMLKLELRSSAETLADYVEQECGPQLEARRRPGRDFGSSPSFPPIDIHGRDTVSPLEPPERDSDDFGEWEDAPTVPRDVSGGTGAEVYVEPAPANPLGTVEFPTRGGQEPRAQAAPSEPTPSDEALVQLTEAPTQPFAEAVADDSEGSDRPLDVTIRQDEPPVMFTDPPVDREPAGERSEPAGQPADQGPASGGPEPPGQAPAGDRSEPAQAPSAARPVVEPRVEGAPPDAVQRPRRGGGRTKLFVWIGIIVILLGGLAGLAIYLLNQPAAPTGPPLYYAHPPSLPESTLVKGLQPLADYLSKRLDRRVEVVTTPNYQALGERLISGEIHVANLPPLLYLQTKAQAPNLRVLAAHSSAGTTTYQSYLVARSDSKIRSVEQLRGHSFCYPDRNSTSGYLLPREFLRSKGLDPDEVFSETRFSGNHAAVMEDIVAGRCDAGAVSSTSWVSARDLIGAKIAQIVFIGSAGETSWDLVCASPELPASLASAIRQDLLEFQPQRDLGRQWISPIFTIDAFVEPDEQFYESIENLEKAARAEGMLE